MRSICRRWRDASRRMASQSSWWNSLGCGPAAGSLPPRTFSTKCLCRSSKASGSVLRSSSEGAAPARGSLSAPAELGAAGCLALAFPLHPPGRSDKTRLDELLAAAIPTHVIQGERDAFGTPAEFPAAVDVTAIPEADHTFAVRKTGPVSRAETLDRVVRAALDWVLSRIAALD